MKAAEEATKAALMPWSPRVPPREEGSGGGPAARSAPGGTTWNRCRSSLRPLAIPAEKKKSHLVSRKTPRRCVGQVGSCPVLPGCRFRFPSALAFGTRQAVSGAWLCCHVQHSRKKRGKPIQGNGSAPVRGVPIALEQWMWSFKAHRNQSGVMGRVGAARIPLCAYNLYILCAGGSGLQKGMLLHLGRYP